MTFEQGSDGCTIIDNYCHVFEAIDGDEGLVFIVGETKQRLLTDIIWEG